MVEYRRYTKADIPAGIEMAKELLKEMPNYANVNLDEDKLKALLIGNVNNLKFHLQVAVEDGELVGLCSAMLMEPIFNRDLIAFDQFLYIRPDRRSAGIATELITGLVVWAKERGATELRLASTTGFSLRAFDSLREKHGFKFLGNIYTKEL